MNSKIILILLFFIQICISQNKTTTIYLIRHAEKEDASKDPELASDGILRSYFWANHFNEVTFDKIFSTNYLRTKSTCKPLAMAKKLEVILYDPKNFNLKDVIENNIGSTILIVGHSNSTPKLINDYLGKSEYEQIDESVYGNLYTLKVNGKEVSHSLLNFK